MLYESIILAQAEKNPSKVAVIYDDNAVTYVELKTQVDAAAACLQQQGLKAGDRLSSFMPNSIDNLVLIFACFKLGIISVPIRAVLPEKDIRHIITDARPALIITEETQASTLNAAMLSLPEAEMPKAILFHSLMATAESKQDLADTKPIAIPADTEATILYTSGSTGLPKGAVHTQQQWFYNATLSKADYTEHDVSLVMLSMNHAYAFGQQIVPTLLHGATLVVCEAFNPVACLNVFKNGLSVNGKYFPITSFFGVPSMYKAICDEANSAEKLKTQLRLLDVAGDVMPAITKQRVTEIFGNILNCTYGMTEGMCLFASSIGNSKSEPIIGRPRAGLEFRILDKNGNDAAEGELCIKGPTVLIRYFNSNQKAEDSIDGFLRTGDQVAVDPDGDLVFVNRKKRIIITAGGYNVNPRETEQALQTDPLVDKACVVGVHNAAGALLIVALVSLQPNNKVSASTLFSLLDTIPQDRKPSIVHIYKHLPLGSTGKLAWMQCQEMAKTDNKNPRENTESHFDVANLAPTFT